MQKPAAEIAEAAAVIADMNKEENIQAIRLDVFYGKLDGQPGIQ